MVSGSILCSKGRGLFFSHKLFSVTTLLEGVAFLLTLGVFYLPLKFFAYLLGCSDNPIAIVNKKLQL